MSGKFNALRDSFRIINRTILNAQASECSCSRVHNTQLSLPTNLTQIRGARFQGIENAQEIAAEKVRHKIAMKELRKGWAQQRLKETEEFEKLRAEKQARWEIKVKLMRKLRRKRQVQKAAARKKTEALKDQIKDLQSQKAAQWRKAVAICYGKYNAQRKGHLNDASRTWITAENLEERIAFALEHPSKLYEEPTAP